MLITNDYLLLKNQKEFTNRVLNLCYQRLQMQLCICFNESIPKVAFTSDNEILSKYYGQKFTGKEARAFFCSDYSICVFHKDSYIATDEIKELYPGTKYAIPVCDIYHELIHHVQYNYSDFIYEDFIESTAELYTVIITGIFAGDYVKESIAIWNLCKNYLKFKPEEFYLFIRDSIVDSNAFKEHLLVNKRFLKILNKKYNSNIKKFFNNFTNDFYIKELQDDLKKNLMYIYNILYVRN